MRYFRKLTLLLAAMTGLPLGAQNIDNMLASTQQIVFIDSIVVDKSDFLSAYLLNSEEGNLQSFAQFFKSNEEPYSIVYLNQLGNKCFYSQNSKLYTSDMIGSQWSKPTALEGLGEFQRMNYPFMSSDGITFYFAAISSEGLGGLDIYVSRYDSETGRFLKAENIGLPFNSEANDYMYVVSELDSIGFFASDRRQPEGKVCIYTFIPNKTRRVYSTSELDEEVIRNRAAISSIADTWGNGQSRLQALGRIEQLRNGAAKKKAAGDFYFVIDDNHVYTKLSDIRNAENRERMKQLLDMKKKFEQLDNELDKARRYYGKATKQERPSLRTEIIDYEQEHTQMLTSIRQLEKLIRNSEIQTLHQH